MEIPIATSKQPPLMHKMATPMTKMPRFDLPGLNLPLNWTPHAEFTKHELDDKYELHSTKIPPQGEGVNLFPVALNDRDVNGGYTS